MKKIGIIALAALFIGVAFRVNTTWKLVDADQAKVHFELIGEGTKGTFSGLKTEIIFNPAELGQASIKATVDAKSIKTDSEGRDKHLRNADFFDVDKYPTISFVSNEIVKTDQGFTAKGNLTMKDKTKAIEVPFQFSEDSNGKGSFKGSMIVHPYDFGVFNRQEDAMEQVKITIDLPLSK